MALLYPTALGGTPPGLLLLLLLLVKLLDLELLELELELHMPLWAKLPDPRPKRAQSRWLGQSRRRCGKERD